MTLYEYRKANNLKQEDVVEMLRPSIPWLNRPIYSLYERGLIASGEISACIQAVFGLESVSTGVVDKCIDEQRKPLKTDFEAFEVYTPLLTAEGPLSRGQLCRRTGLSDREVRRQINELRKAGVRIVSSSSGNGYWITEDADEYRQFRTEMLSRAYDNFKTVRAMDRNLPGQVRMDE